MVISFRIITCFNPDSVSNREGRWLTGCIDQCFSRVKKVDFVLEKRNGSHQSLVEFGIYVTWLYLV